MSKQLLITLLFSFVLCQCFAQDTTIVEDLRYSWIDVGQDELTPAANPSSLNHIMFFVDQSQREILEICNDEPYHLWVNKKLIMNHATGCKNLHLQELHEIFFTDTLAIHLATKGGFSKLTTKLLTVKVDAENAVALDPRIHQHYHNHYYLILSIFLISLALFRRIYPLRFSRLLSNPFKSRSTSIDEYYSDFYRLDNILFILLFSFMVATSLQYLALKESPFNYESTNFKGFLSDWLLKWSLIASFCFAKHFIAKLLSTIFSIKHISNILNQDFLNYFFWVFSLILTFTLFEFSTAGLGGFLSADILIFFTILSIAIFQIGMFLKMYKMNSSNKILIISYLCGSEFLPGFIIIYIFLK